MFKRSTVLRLSVAATLGVSAMLSVPATAAQAALRDCWDRQWNSYSGWQAGCATSTNPGTDQYRAVAYCVREDGRRTTAYGAWVNRIPYPASTAACPGNYSAGGGKIQIG